MLRLRRAAAVTSVGICLFACSRHLPDDDVVATVGTMPITIAEVRDSARWRYQGHQSALTPQEWHQVLDGLIRQKVMVLEARKRGLNSQPNLPAVPGTLAPRNSAEAQELYAYREFLSAE